MLPIVLELIHYSSSSKGNLKHYVGIPTQSMEKQNTKK